MSPPAHVRHWPVSPAATSDHPTPCSACDPFRSQSPSRCEMKLPSRAQDLTQPAAASPLPPRVLPSLRHPPSRLPPPSHPLRLRLPGCCVARVRRRSGDRGTAVKHARENSITLGPYCFCCFSICQAELVAARVATRDSAVRDDKGMGKPLGRGEGEREAWWPARLPSSIYRERESTRVLRRRILMLRKDRGAPEHRHAIAEACTSPRGDRCGVAAVASCTYQRRTRLSVRERV